MEIENVSVSEIPQTRFRRQREDVLMLLVKFGDLVPGRALRIHCESRKQANSFASSLKHIRAKDNIANMNVVTRRSDLYVVRMPYERTEQTRDAARFAPKLKR